MDAEVNRAPCEDPLLHDWLDSIQFVTLCAYKFRRRRHINLQEASARKTYLKTRDFEKHGYTEGCEGCRRMRTGGREVRPHNAQCRQRMEEQLNRLLARMSPRLRGEAERFRDLLALEGAGRREAQAAWQAAGFDESLRLRDERARHDASSALPHRHRLGLARPSVV